MTKTGTDRITAAFTQAHQTQTAALMPYFTLGYPDAETSLEIIEAIATYSDLLELGVPFSDPLADGPTVQHSTQVSLENGTTTAGCLEIVRKLRQRGVQTPIMLMGYVNPILAYGEAEYVHDAVEAGVDGFIVPDLPPEEAESLDSKTAEAGLALIPFLAPTSNARRIDLVTAQARGFIYLVSVTGVTGARSQVRTDLAGFVNQVRRKTAVPLAVGFGISNPAQAAEVGQVADGVIVGSALINATNAVEANKAEAAVRFVKSLREGLSKN
ncbi:tryptophan synthase subunit alpha [Candidatus Leptofilum sp.]|uniref:tryptophan synthase subunit alpha n=1 Tax=Candidatus Leptofilum sp. TaxID=3241576 RepID=UPI003B592E48